MSGGRLAALVAAIALSGCARDAYTDPRVQPLGVETRGDDLAVRFWTVDEPDHWCPGADVARRGDRAIELTIIRAPIGERPRVDLPVHEVGGRHEVVVPGGAHGVVAIADGPVISNRR